MSLVIDSHQHFWQLDNPFDYAWLEPDYHTPIRRDFLPSDLEPHLKQIGVDRTVFVQSQHNTEETRWALSLAKQVDFIAGVVGWVDLASDQCQHQLLALKEDPNFVGIRHITQDEPDDNFIIRDDVVTGLKVLQKYGVPFAAGLIVGEALVGVGYSLAIVFG